MKLLILLITVFPTMIYANSTMFAQCSDGNIFIDGKTNHITIQNRERDEVTQLSKFYGPAKLLNGRVGELYHSDVKLMGGSLSYRTDEYQDFDASGASYWKVLRTSYFNNNNGKPYNIRINYKWGKGAAQSLAYFAEGVQVSIYHYNSLNKKLRKTIDSETIELDDCKFYEQNIMNYIRSKGKESAGGKRR